MGGGICLNPLSAYMPPPIDHAILRLAVLPLSKNDALGLPPSLHEEIRAKVEAAVVDLKKSVPRLEVVERSRLEVAFRELEFQAGGRVRDDTFVGVGRMLGADHLLTYQITVQSTRDVNRSVPMYPGDATEFGLKGGIIRALTHGKVIRIETGTVVFQQTTEQSITYPRPASGSYWSTSALGSAQRVLVLSTLGGLFLALEEALLPPRPGFSGTVSRVATQSSWTTS